MRPLCIPFCLLIASVALAADPCPESVMVLGYPEVTITSTQPRGSECRPGVGMFGDPPGVSCAEYDLVTSHVQSSSQSPGVNSLVAGGVSAVDAYRVIAATPGQPVAIVARLTYSISVSISSSDGSGGAQVRLISGGVDRSDDLVVHAPCAALPECQPRNGVLEIEISTTTGTPFQLILVAHTGGGGADALASGRLSFVGLPLGFTVVSCQNPGGATTAASTSWARLKAIYR